MATADPFLEILDQMKALHEKKGHDYGSTDDPYAGYAAAEKFGIPAWVSSATRIAEKLNRVAVFVLSGKLRNESVEDSLLDIAMNAVICLCLIRRIDVNHVEQPLRRMPESRRE